MKTTACHEISRVSVCFAARADGTKLKLMVVFKDAKRETSAMKKEFRRRHAVVGSWKNACMTLLICNENTSLAIDLGVYTNRLKYIYSHAILS